MDKLKNPKGKAVLYARFSPRKNAADCESCEAQLEQIKKYCELYDFEIIGEYRDENQSGKDDESRTNFSEAMELTIKHKATLIVRDLSRFGRNTIQVLVNAERLWKAGAGFASVNERFDTTTPAGRFAFRIKAAVDELEREQIAERTSAAMLRKQANGQRMGSRIPYGFSADPNDSKRIIRDEYEQDQIARVLELADEGRTLREIALAMNLEGRHCRNKDWYHQAVERVLRRERLAQ